MPFLSVIGVSHHTSPVEIRERFAYTSDYAHDEISSPEVETVWLSTCNRTEMYSISRDIGAAEQSFLGTLDIPSEFTSQCTFRLEGDEAVRHLFRVASGLDSLVVGEGEILGQVRRALAAAQNNVSAGPTLTRLFEYALATGKRVRSETEINRYPASVSTAAASIVQQRRYGSLEDSSVLVIGAGDMGRAVARCLKGMKTREIGIANRTHARAEELASETGARALEWPVGPEDLASYDAAICCTSANGFVLTRSTVEAALVHGESGEPMQLVDIAVPRDIDPDVRSLPGVRLSNIDDVRVVVDDALGKRTRFVESAEDIISEQVDGFMYWLAVRGAADSIRLMRERADSIRTGELDWAMPKLSGLSQSEREIVKQLSTRLVNKLLHTPTLRLREMPADNVPDTPEALVRYLFDLESDTKSNGNDARTSATGPGRTT